MSGCDTMLGGNAWVDSVGALVCHNKGGVYGIVLANGELLLHMMRVQAIGVRDQSQNASLQSMFHTEDVRRKSGSDDKAIGTGMSSGGKCLLDHTD